MMKKFLTVGCATVVFGLGVIGPVKADTSVSNKELTHIYTMAEIKSKSYPVAAELAARSTGEKKEEYQAKATEYYGAANDLSKILHYGASNMALSEHVVGEVIRDYEGLKQGAKSAAQVSQAADEAMVKMQRLQIAQNQQIITLLQSIESKLK